MRRGVIITITLSFRPLSVGLLHSGCATLGEEEVLVTAAANLDGRPRRRSESVAESFTADRRGITTASPLARRSSSAVLDECKASQRITAGV